MVLFTSETIIYNGIISTVESRPKIMKKRRTRLIRIYLPSLPLNFRLVNLSDNSGRRVIINRDKMTVYISRAAGDPANNLSRGSGE